MLPVLHPRRRRLRRPGRGGRDAQPLDDQGLPRRRHDPPRHQQPARLHHRRPTSARSSEYPHRRGQDGAGADLPRERRRPRGLRARRPAGVRATASVPQGRRHRHGLLPAPRPQRGRRPELHPAAHVQAHRRPALGAQALHRGAGEAGRHHARGGRGRRSTTSSAGCRRRSTRPVAGAARRGRRGAAAAAARRRAAPRRHRRRPRRPLDAGLRRAVAPRPRASRVHPKLASSSRPATRCSQDGEVDWALAEALAFGSLLLEGTVDPPRRPGLAPRHVLASATPCSSTTRPAPSTRRSRTSAPTRAKFWIYDSLLSEYAALGFEYGYSVVNKDALVVLGGAVRRLRQRRPDHHRPVPRGRRGQVGPDLRARAAAAARLRGPGPRALARPASSASSRSCAEDNIQVCNATTVGAVLPPAAPADAPRRAQAADRVHAEVAAAGQAVALADRRARPQGSFQEVLDDPARRPTPATAVQRVVFCSGKVAYDALAARDERGARRSAVVRVEQLYPWPVRAVPTCSPATRTPSEVVWLQEEPENMGPWNFVQGPAVRRARRRLPHCATSAAPSRAAPPPAATPSTCRSSSRSSTRPSADVRTSQ